MSELFVNKFDGGIDGDSDPRVKAPNTYSDAFNIEIAGVDNLFVAKNIKGTTEVAKIITSSILPTQSHILGAFSCIGLFQDMYGMGVTEYNKSIAIFLYNYTDSLAIKHQIYLYDTTRDVLHLLIDDQLGFDETLIIDGVVFIEQRESSIYFVDNKNTIRRIHCKKTPSTSLSLASLDVRRIFQNNAITANQVSVGGSLLAGTYQFVYRFYSTNDNVYSAWSVITNPVSIPYIGVENLDKSVGGVAGTVTDKKVRVVIDNSTPFNAMYDSIQIAVIKNIDGSTNAQTVAYQLNPSKDIYNNAYLDYAGSANETQIDVSDIVIEDAAIKTARTISLQNNRLFLGSIQYNGLQYDKGDITFGYAASITEEIGNKKVRLYSDPQSFTSTYTVTTVYNISPTNNKTNFQFTSITPGNKITFQLTGAGPTPTYSYAYTFLPGDTVNTVANKLYIILSSNSPVGQFSVLNDTLSVLNVLFVNDVQDGGTLEHTTAAQTPYGYTNPLNTADARSNMRDEVYRYGITYVDAYGNWSNPQVLDFSNHTDIAQKYGQNPLYSIGRHTAIGTDNGAADGLWYIELDSGAGAIATPGSYIILETPGPIYKRCKIVGIDNIVTTYRTSSRIFVDEELSTVGVFGQASAVSNYWTWFTHDEWSHSTNGIDWKFPSREMKDFGILSSASKIKALGLRIEGIRNHPSWAKGFAIVIARRKKNVVFQSIHIPCNIMKQTPQEGTWVFTGNTVGIFSIKDMANGSAKNYGLEFTSGNNVNEAQIFNQNYFGYSEALKMSFIVPPEYIYNTAGVPYSNYQWLAGDKIRAVDGCSFQASQNYNNYLFGGDPSEVILVNPYAEAWKNYYTDGTKKNLFRFYNQFRKYFGNGVASVLESIKVDVSNTGYSFSYFPMQSNPLMSDIVKFGDYSSISTDTTGNIPKTQRGILLGLDNTYGDLSYVSLNTVNNTPFNVCNEVRFGSPVDDTSININYSPRNAANAIKQPLQNATSATVIVNYERGLGDDRYGDVANYNEFLFTGTYVPLSNADIAGNIGKDVSVFGGDVFITKAHVKVSDTRMGVFANGSQVGAGGQPVWRLQGYGTDTQVVTFYVESEVNCEMQAERDLPNLTGVNSPNDWKTSFINPYNNSYSAINQDKVFVPFNKDLPVKDKFPARVAYSDQKIYQSNIAGFDRFRVASEYDQDETYGEIFKLIRGNDGRMYSLQEYGISYLPVDANIIQDGDGGNLSIRSGEVIGIPNYLSVNAGCQHTGTVQASDTGIYFVDAKNMAVGVITGQVSKISDIGAIKFFTTRFNVAVPNHKIKGFFDFNRKQYIVSKSTNTYNTYSNGALTSTNTSSPFVFVYNTKLNKWTTQLSTTGIDYQSMVYCDKNMYVIGKDNANNLSINTLYTGDYGKILGATFDSTITYTVNPMPDYSKVFSNLSLNATNRASSIDMKVFKEGGVEKDVLGMNFDVSPREGLYKIQILRDQNGNRLRGLFTESLLKISNVPNVETRISTINTKYRPSYRVK